MLTWVEIDSQAIKYNLLQFRRLIGKKTLLMPVVKANAYGHGFLEISKICNKSREVDRICVVNLDEAYALIKAKIKKPIMILSFYENDEHKLCSCARAGVIFPIYTEQQIKILNRVGEMVKKKIKVHLKIDTGATRLGLYKDEGVVLAKKIKNCKNLILEGIFSHFASSEDDKIYTEYQLKQFDKIITELEKKQINIPIKHFACSSASILYNHSHFNAIRLGLSLYGLYPDELSQKKIRLYPALSWHTTIIQIKTIPAWTKIGYGGTYTAKKTTKLALLPVGYWDGYDRRLSNNAYVLIHGKKCPIRGRICMNLCMADITGLKKVKVGDKATIVGKQRERCITIDELSKLASAVNYEIVDRINPLIPRLVK